MLSLPPPQEEPCQGRPCLDTGTWDLKGGEVGQVPGSVLLCPPGPHLRPSEPLGGPALADTLRLLSPMVT